MQDFIVIYLIFFFLDCMLKWMMKWWATRRCHSAGQTSVQCDAAHYSNVKHRTCMWLKVGRLFPAGLCNYADITEDVSRWDQPDVSVCVCVCPVFISQHRKVVFLLPRQFMFLSHVPWLTPVTSVTTTWPKGSFPFSIKMSEHSVVVELDQSNRQQKEDAATDGEFKYLQGFNQCVSLYKSGGKKSRTGHRMLGCVSRNKWKLDRDKRTLRNV